MFLAPTLLEVEAGRIKAKVRCASTATAMTRGIAHGDVVVSTLDDALEGLNDEEKVYACNHSILGAKVHRKVAQGYQAKSGLGKFINSIGNSFGDSVLEFGAGKIASSL